MWDWGSLEILWRDSADISTRIALFSNMSPETLWGYRGAPFPGPRRQSQNPPLQIPPQFRHGLGLDNHV
jgi:hypothetical protein